MPPGALGLAPTPAALPVLVALGSVTQDEIVVGPSGFARHRVSLTNSLGVWLRSALVTSCHQRFRRVAAPLTRTQRHPQCEPSLHPASAGRTYPWPLPRIMRPWLSGGGEER